MKNNLNFFDDYDGGYMKLGSFEFKKLNENIPTGYFLEKSANENFRLFDRAGNNVTLENEGAIINMLKR